MKLPFQGFSNLGIRYKLFASYLVVIMVPFLLLLIIHITVTQRENKETAVYASQKMLDETKSYLEYKSQAITEVLNFIAFNNLVQTSVGADSAQYEDVNVWHLDALELSRLVNQFRYNDDIDNIQIYMKHGLAGATENSDFMTMDRIESSAWYRSYASSDSVFAWMPSSVVDGDPDNEEITVLRKIPSEHNIRQFDGIVRASVKPSAMESVLNHAVLTTHAQAVLFNDSGHILSRSERFSIPDSWVARFSRSFAQAEDNDAYYNDDYSIGGVRHLVDIQAIPNSDMKVALLVPYADILQSSTKARNRIVSIFLVVVPFMLPFSFFVAASATKRIRRLIMHVRKLKHGQFQIAPLPTSQDEIGELAHNFNVMVDNISNLMDETYTLGREVKNKELQALQAQINPHFLYNTLDLINIMAIESNAGDIKAVVDGLTVFYRLSLSNGSEYVTFESELKHIEAYVRIQNMRFGGIRLELEVSRAFYPDELPKILLQPLVENAILHGILEKESEEGVVRVSAWTDKGDIVIRVSDDGVGMDADQLSAMAAAHRSKSGAGGYGVSNIQERLQLAYGPLYGLRFESAPMEGTAVYLRVPRKRREEMRL